MDFRRIVGFHRLILTEPPMRVPTEQIPDAPLLGNGDIGAAIGGNGALQTFFLGKNDFWTQAHLGESDDQRYERLIHENARRTGAHITTLGRVTLSAPRLEGADYRYEISLLDARAQGRFTTPGGETAVFTSLICAAENLLLTRIEWDGREPLEVTRALAAGPLGEYEVFSADCGLRENALWFSYAANPQNLPGRRAATVASRALGGETAAVADRPHFSQSVTTRIYKGRPVLIATVVLSDLNVPDGRHRARALERCASLTEADARRAVAAHEAWWLDFWSRSQVCLSDKSLEKWYYAGQYVIASAIRPGQPVPGLNGPWNTVEKPRWTGSYTLNYNYESPLWGLYASNHVDLTDAYPDTLLAVMPLARRFARDLLGADGLYLPVELGPWGTVCSMLFHNQKTYASFCCVNLFMRYYMTLDKAFARAVFPFVRETALFWESYLTLEDGRYVDEEDCPHEESIPSHCRNNPLALSLIRQTMRGALDMAAALDMPEDDHARAWQDILDRLSPLPQIRTKTGETVVAYSDPGGRQWYDRGGVGLWFVYPGGMVTPDSDPALIELARATFRAHDAWDDGNAFNTWYVVAVRLGIDPELVLEKMRAQLALHGWQNGVIWHGGGGIEDSSGVVSYVNEAMLQSAGGTIRLFEAWPRSLSGAFESLRAYGAFLVSAAWRDGAVQPFTVFSEAGSRLRLKNPWPGRSAACRNGAGEERVFPGELIETDTSAGQTYAFRPI